MSFVPRQERDEVARKKVLAIAAASLAIGAVAVGISALLLGPRPPNGPPASVSTLETSLVADTRRGLDLGERQRASLDEWGWVDRDAGIAHIPIDRAMDIVAAEPQP
jgi:hypothetical protein